MRRVTGSGNDLMPRTCARPAGWYYRGGMWRRRGRASRLQGGTSVDPHHDGVSHIRWLMRDALRGRVIKRNMEPGWLDAKPILIDWLGHFIPSHALDPDQAECSY
ncbi:MAG TPA: hypothetical protein VN614_02995 [Rhodanobacter sp.]|nr:hypothetical protein [Rhodanobacter sp.]